MVSLELLLAALLTACLVFGFRLERRLRALREGQAGFVKAMSELDGAAQRTEAGLERLRRATEEAGEALTPRIGAAEAAAARLEALTAEAELAARRAEDAAEAVQESARALAAAVPGRRAPEPVVPAPEAAPRLAAPDFAAMLARKPAAASDTTRQPLPTRSGGEVPPAPSRLRQAAALLRGG
jgi:hypothetical protein